VSEPVLEPGAIGASDRNRWIAADNAVELTRKNRPSPTLSVHAFPTAINIDLSRTAMVIVDMQNDFCHTDGWLASIGVDVSAAQAPIPALAMALTHLRESGVAVVWLNRGTRQGRANLPPNAIHVFDPHGTGVGIGSTEPTGSPVLHFGSWGAAVVEELRASPADRWVHKHRMSGFWDTDLDSVLRNLDVTALLFAGVNADQCVLATLIDAACIGYDVIMLEDASATTSPAFCWDATVYNVRQCIGFTALLSDIVAAMVPA